MSCLLPATGVVAVLNTNMDILNRTWCQYEMWCVVGAVTWEDGKALGRCGRHACDVCI